MQPFSTTITDTDTWRFRSSAYFNKIWVNGLSGTDGEIWLNGQNIYGTLSGNTALISSLQSLTGNWESTYTTVQNNSATTWLNDSAVDLLVHSTSGDWNSVYTQVNVLSTTWETNISTLSTDVQSLSTAIRDLSGEYLTIVDAALEYQPLGSYLSGNSNLGDLNDVIINSPSTDQIIKFNGVDWINGNQSTVNGGAGIDYFYDDTLSDISPYSILNKVPSLNTEIVQSVTANNNRIFFTGYLSPSSGIGGTQIDSGVWTFDIWGYNDVPNNDTQLIFDLYTRDLTGGESFLFEVSSGLLNDTLDLFSITTIQPSFPIISTDRLLVKIYGDTTAVTDRVIRFVHGGNTHYSHFNTPLITRHNDLAGLQGGDLTERYHLNTDRYTKVNDNIDGFISTQTTVNSNSSLWNTASTVNLYLPLSGGELTGNLTLNTNLSTLGNVYISGRLGLGTTNPSTTLHLAGTLSANNAQIDTGIILSLVARPTGFSVSLAGAGAGNVNTGDHYYYVSYVTARGETELSISNGGATFTGSTASKITTTAGNGQVDITVSASSDYRVTGIKIYRTQLGGFVTKLVATVTNANQTYRDNIADASLTGPDSLVRDNTTNDQIHINNSKSFFLGLGNTLVGVLAGRDITTGSTNVCVGANAALNLTTATNSVYIGWGAGQNGGNSSDSVAIGKFAMYKATGANNIAIGSAVLFGLTTGTSNVGIGGGGFTTGTQNIAVGSGAAGNTATGSYNTAVGSNALNGNTTGSYNTGLGHNALLGTRPTSKAITAFANSTTSPGVKTTVTSATHGLLEGATGIGIYGTTSYNGTSYTVTNVTLNTFDIVKVYVANDATGWWGKESEGRYNVGIGESAGRTVTTGDSNVFIGMNAGYSASQLASATNSIAIGLDAYTTESNQVVLGNSSIAKTSLRGRVSVNNFALYGGNNPNIEAAKLGTTSILLGSAGYQTASISAPANNELRIESASTHSSNTFISLYTNTGWASATEKVRINDIGNVGIGVTTPNEKLTVTGNISATGSIMASSFSVSGHVGYTHPNQVMISDAITGQTIKLYLRGGVLSID